MSNSKPRNFWIRERADYNEIEEDRPTEDSEHYTQVREVIPQDAEFRECFDEMLKSLTRAAHLACESKSTTKSDIAKFAAIINRAEGVRHGRANDV